MRNVYVCVNYVIEVFTIYDNGDGGNTADFAGNSWKWRQMLWKYRGTETGAAGIPRIWNLFMREPSVNALEILPTIKVSCATVRILSKLLCEMSRVATNYVFDSWSSATVLCPCCKKTMVLRVYDAGQLKYMLSVKFYCIWDRTDRTEHGRGRVGYGQKLVRGRVGMDHNKNVRRIFVTGSMPPCRLRRRKFCKFDYAVVHSEVLKNALFLHVFAF